MSHDDDMPFPPEGQRILYWGVELGARPQDHVRTDISRRYRHELAAVLGAGAESHPDIRYKGSATCRICGEQLGARDLHGHGYEWPEKAEHYVLAHDVWTPGCEALLQASRAVFAAGRPRGEPGPIDPARNPILAWGVDAAADIAKDVARDGAIGWALRPAMPAITAVRTGMRAHDATRGMYRGTKMMDGRRVAPMAQVGAEWWHGTGDRTRAMGQITADLHALVTDLMAQIQMRRRAVEENPSDAATLAFEGDTRWLQADVQTALEQWKTFVARESESLWTLIATDWRAFVSWSERIRRLRELARARGFVLTSPDPGPLPKTIWERGEEGEGGPAAWLGVLKVGVAAALGISGFIGLYTVVRAVARRARPQED